MPFLVFTAQSFDKRAEIGSRKPCVAHDPWTDLKLVCHIGRVRWDCHCFQATATQALASPSGHRTGALSVGIGFGLQNIVTILSGLILLFEALLSQAMVVAEEPGYVRRIRVRATEIETFDRSTVIIPNSALITAPVTNWFLHNRIGRCIVEIGVSYESDPEQVRDILLECAQAHPRVLRWPEPVAYLMNFADSALVFYCASRFGILSLSTQQGSEVRMAILKALREAGISIPFPQRDVRLITTHTPTTRKEDPTADAISPSSQSIVKGFYTVSASKSVQGDAVDTKQTFPVPSSVAAAACGLMQRSMRLFKESIESPESFWAKQGQRLTWMTPYTRVKDVSWNPDDFIFAGMTTAH